jgi:hypothetical protein
MIDAGKMRRPDELYRKDRIICIIQIRWMRSLPEALGHRPGAE